MVGLIGGTIAVLVVIRIKHAKTCKFLTYFAPSLILGYTIGRVGCFLSGDGDYGPPF